MVETRDGQVDNPFAKDLQIQGVHNARRYLGDRLARVAKPHRILDPKAGPLIAVKLHVLTRKSLGGIQTDLDSRVLKADGSVLDGLFAAGEAAGFGGGGAHGYNALEGSFLGGVSLHRPRRRSGHGVTGAPYGDRVQVWVRHTRGAMQPRTESRPPSCRVRAPRLARSPLSGS